jgi:hypothetical protein
VTSAPFRVQICSNLPVLGNGNGCYNTCGILPLSFAALSDYVEALTCNELLHAEIWISAKLKYFSAFNCRTRME